MSIKKIKRTYFSKKLGKTVTKIYEYDASRYTGRRKKSLLVVGKNGRVYQDRLDEILAATTDIGTKEDIKATVKQASRNKEKLSIKSLSSKVSTNKIEKIFINAGYTEEEITKELGISSKDLYDPSNWKDSTFTHGGKTWDFQFSYTGKVMIER